jgi:hypothetical protein
MQHASLWCTQILSTSTPLDKGSGISVAIRIDPSLIEVILGQNNFQQLTADSLASQNLPHSRGVRIEVEVYNDRDEGPRDVAYVHLDQHSGSFRTR